MRGRRRRLLERGVESSRVYYCILATLAYMLVVILFTRNTYLLLLTPFITIGSSIIYSIIARYMFYKRIDQKFIQILSLLYGFESIGLHLNDLFNVVSREEVEVDHVYRVIARDYMVLERIYGEPLSALNQLSRRYRGTRFSKFLSGYLDILSTTGDTLSYVENCVEEELNILYNKSLSLISIIENFYESYLIILMSIMVLSGLPMLGVFTGIVHAVLLICGLIGYSVATYISKNLYYNESIAVVGLSYFYIVIACISPLVMSVFNSLALLTLFMVVSIALSRAFHSWKLSIEDCLVDFIEDLYSETRHGFSVDRAIIRLSLKENTLYKPLVDGLSRLLSLGLTGSIVASKVDTSPLVQESMKLLLTPIEYSSEHERHVGYTAKFVRRLFSIRYNITSRSRVLYIYTLILPATVYAIVYGLKAISSPMLPVNPYPIPGYIVSASIPAWIIASKTTNGYGMNSWKNLVILVENLALYLATSL